MEGDGVAPPCPKKRVSSCREDRRGGGEKGERESRQVETGGRVEGGVC